MKTETQDKMKKKKIGRFIFIFIVGAIVLSNTAFKDKIEKLFIKGDKTLEIVAQGKLNLSEYNNIKIYDEGIALYANNTIFFYSFEGIELWNQSINYEDPLIHMGQEKIYICNRQSGEINALNQAGEEVWSYNPGERINQIVEKEGRLMAFLSVSEELQQANVIDKNGQLIGNYAVENEEVINSSITKDGEIYLVNALDITGESIKSKLTVLTINGRLLAEKVFENEVVIYSEFLKNNHILVVTDNKINYFGEDYKLLWNRNVDDTIKYVTISEEKDRIYLLTSKGGGTLETIGLDGRTEKETIVEGDLSRIYIENKDVYLFGQTRVNGIDGDIQFLNYSSQETIYDLAIYNDKYVFLTPDGIRVANMINKKSN